ncbi:HDOD domain-containing protein [Solirubrobacter taibaiensis]|nr:HDOD domain-containing protein [Solirubrobacter taibaiensis]
MPTRRTPDPPAFSAPAHSDESGCVLLARQPILDAQHQVIAYELLYRSSSATGEPAAPLAATANVLVSTIADLGLDAVVGQHLAFLNVTREFVLAMPQLAQFLPPQRVVLELIEDQLVDEQLLEALAALVDDGFRLALDDFVYSPELEPLLELADIVKLDLRALAPDALAEHVRVLKPRGLTLVAEKVETREEQLRCHALGFDAYQGYYFQQPTLMSGQALPSAQLTTLFDLVQSDPGASVDTLVQIIERDLGLSHRLLRFANSAAISPTSPVRSLRQALSLLGTVRIRRMAMLFAVAGIRDAPDVLLNTALARARMCELLAPERGVAPERAFTVGLFSLLGALLNQSLDDLMRETPFDSRLVDAVVRQAGPEGEVLKTVVAFERGDFVICGPDTPLLHRAYAWADDASGRTADAA